MIEKTFKIEVDELIDALSDDDYLTIFHSDNPRIDISSFALPVTIDVSSGSGDLLSIGLGDVVRDIIAAGNPKKSGPQDEEQMERLINLQTTLRECLKEIDAALSIRKSQTIEILERRQ